MRLQTSSFGTHKCVSDYLFLGLFFSMYVTFFGFVGELVAHHVYGNESQQHRGEGDKEAQIFGHRLLNVSNTQKHNSGIQVHQPVEPKCNDNKSYNMSFISLNISISWLQSLKMVEIYPEHVHSPQRSINPP